MIKNKEERIAYALKNLNKTYEELSPVFGIKEESVRKFFARNNLPNKRINVQSIRAEVSLPDMVRKCIKTKQKSLREISDYCNCAPKAALAAIEELQNENVIIDNFTDGGFSTNFLNGFGKSDFKETLNFLLTQSKSITSTLISSPIFK